VSKQATTDIKQPIPGSDAIHSLSAVGLLESVCPNTLSKARSLVSCVAIPTAGVGESVKVVKEARRSQVVPKWQSGLIKLTASGM